MRPVPVAAVMAAACGWMALRASAATYNAVQDGAFGAGPTWGLVEPWDPSSNDVFTVGGFAVRVDDAEGNGFPAGGTLNLDAGGTLVIRRVSTNLSLVVRGTLTLNGGALDLAGEAMQRLQGVINVVQNVVVTSATTSGGSNGLYLGDGTSSVTGSGSIAFQGGGSKRLTLDATDTWSGALTVSGCSLMLSGTRTTLGDADMQTSNSVLVGVGRDLAGVLGGIGACKCDNGRAFSLLSGAVLAPGTDPATAGTLWFGNSQYSSTVLPTLTLRSNSVFRVDIPNATQADALATQSNFPSGGAGDHSVNFVIQPGAVLRPVLYTPAEDTALDVVIMQVVPPAAATISGVFDTFDMAGVPAGWRNPATDLRNGGRELHLLAEYGYSKPTVTVAATDDTAAESDLSAGEFTISRGAFTNGDLTVHYSVGGTATPGDDYVTLAGSVLVADGSNSMRVVVAPLDDADLELPETVVLTLTTNDGYFIGSPASGAVSVISDDTGATVTVTASIPAAAENGPVPGEFTVSRGTDTGDELTVYYTVAGTAEAGSDYAALPGSVAIAAGAFSAVVPVIPMNDADPEGPETVTLTLSTSPHYFVGSPSSNTVTIADDDAASGGPYNDRQSGLFGDPAVWGAPSWWIPDAATYTMDDAYAVTLNESNTAPAGSALDLLGGTLNFRRAGSGTGAPYPDYTVTLTLNLGGGAIDVAGNSIYRLQGAINVATDTTVHATAPTGSSLGFYLGDGASAITGAGRLTFTGNAHQGTPRLYLDASDPWSGELSVQGGTLSLNGNRTSVSNVEIHAGAVVLGVGRHLSGRLSGSGTYKTANGVTIVATNTATLAPGVGPGAVGVLFLGNSQSAASLLPTLVLQRGSVLEVDVAGAAAADRLGTASNYPSGGSGDHSVNFTIQGGAKLLPKLYTPTASTNIDVVIIATTGTTSVITGVYGTGDIEAGGVPDGWINLATDLRNGGRELHFTAEWQKPARSTVLVVR